MDKLYKIKDALWNELEKSETAKSGELKGGELEAIHKLTDTIKNIDKICMLEDEGGYSQGGEWTARELWQGQFLRQPRQTLCARALQP